MCNFLDAPELVFPSPGKSEATKDDDTRVIYRHYATLYFVFVVDGAESELGILDLIQVFVESLDRTFENVCELDLIFHFDEVGVRTPSTLTSRFNMFSMRSYKEDSSSRQISVKSVFVVGREIGPSNPTVQAAQRNRKASAASANPLMPSMLVAPGAKGRSENSGARRWLPSIGV